MGEELDIAETKCLTLKSELNYMMGVCQKAQTEIKGSKGAFDISQEPISLSKSPRLKFPVEYNDANNEIKVTDKISNCNVFQKLHNIEKIVEETSGTNLSNYFIYVYVYVCTYVRIHLNICIFHRYYSLESKSCPYFT